MYTLFLYEIAGTGSDVVHSVGGPPSIEKDALERYVPTGRRVTNTLISVPACADSDSDYSEGDGQGITEYGLPMKSNTTLAPLWFVQVSCFPKVLGSPSGTQSPV